MNLVLLRNFVMVSTTIVSILCKAGGWSGNGGGSAPYDVHNPWFLGEEPIPYCLITGKGNFPSNPAIHMIITRSAEKWAQFFERYELNGSVTKTSSYKFPDGIERRLSLKFVPATDCTNVEKYCSPNKTEPDSCHQALSDKILFLLGKPNEVVENFLRMNPKMDGASLRTDYNHKTYRSGGIVWINELGAKGGWSSYSHMILHEMGHVFGMKHDSCWVMAKDVVALLTGWNGIGGLDEIEAPNWPYSLKERDQLVFTDRKFSFGNFKPGYYPNNIFLRELWEKFGFSENGSFKLSGDVISSHINGLTIKISFEEEGSMKKIDLEGDLSQKFYSDDFSMVPNIYTLWSNSLNSPSYMKSIFLTSGWSSDNLQGTLRWGDQIIPVTLERRRGLILSMFFPETMNWLTFATVQSSQDLDVKKNF